MFKRILVKLSGEMLAGDQGFGISPTSILRFAKEIKEVQEEGVEIALVIGGGNIFRGLKGASQGMERAHADYMGMLATVINALAFQDALEQQGVTTRVMTALDIDRVAEPYIRRRAMRHLEKGIVVIFAAGTGNPYFSTDTGAALRAAEIQADILLKGTKVEGVYNKDPVKHPDAQLYESLPHKSLLQDNLKVMDSTAASLCMENRIPMIVFNLHKPGNILRIVRGEQVGTRIETPDDSN